MLDPADTWAKKFKDLKPVADPSWSMTLATTVGSLVTGKLEIATIMGSPATFNFMVPTFAGALASLAPVQTAPEGAKGFADAWEAAINSSIMLVLPGAYVGAPAPPTLYSVVFSTIVDPPSVALAKVGLISALVAIKPSEDAAKDFASAFRNAFLALTWTTQGLNSLPPPPAGPGPLPFPNPMAPSK